MKKSLLLIAMLWGSVLYAQKPELVLQQSAMDSLQQMKYSADGLLLAGLDSMNITIWDVRTGKIVRELKTPTVKTVLDIVGMSRGEITDFEFHPSGLFLAASHNNVIWGKYITYWNLKDGTYGEFKAKNNVKDLSFSPDGKYLAAGTKGNQIVLFDVESKKIALESPKLKGTVLTVDFSQDGRLMASAGRDKTIRIWDASNLNEIATLSGHKKPIHSVSFNHDGSLLCSGSNDQTVMLWDVKNGKALNRFDLPDSKIKDVHMSPDGSYMIGVTNKGLIKIWDVETGKLRKEIADAGKGSVVDMNPYGGYFSLFRAKQSEGGLKKKFFTKTADEFNSALNLRSLFRNTKFEIEIIEQASLETIRTLSLNIPLSTLALSFNEMGDKLLSLSEDKFIKIWNLEQAKMEQAVPVDLAKGNFATAYFTPNFHHAVIADMTKLEILPFWDGDKYRLHEPLFSMSAEDCRINTITQSANKRVCAVADHDNAVHIWKFPQNEGKVEYFKPDGSMHGKKIILLSLSPDGKYMAIVGKAKITIWDIENNKAVKSNISMKTKGAEGTKIVAVFPSTTGTHFLAVVKDKMNGGTAMGMETTSQEIPAIVAIENSSGNFEKRELVTDEDMTKSVISGIGSMFKNKKEDDEKKGVIESQMEDVMMSLAGIGQIAPFCPEKNFGLAPAVNGLVMVRFNPDEKMFQEKIREIKLPGLLDLMIDMAYLRSAYSFYFTLGSNGERVAAAKADGSIELWNIKDGLDEHLLTIISEDEAYVMITPELDYITERAGTNLIGFRRENTMYSFEEMDLFHNRPDKVIDRISDPKKGIIERTDELSEQIGNYEAAYKKRVEKMGYSIENLDPGVHKPTIVVNNLPDIPLHTSKPQLILDINAMDDISELSQLNIWVNGVPIYGMKGKALNGFQSKNYSESLPVDLSYGMNRIQVSVRNAQGAESWRENIPSVEYVPENFEKPDLYVIAIGVSEFENPEKNLDYAAKDANDVARLFSARKGEYAQVNTIQISNQDATKEKILALKDELKKTSIHDHVILFVATHGTINKALDYYLAPYEMDFSNPEAHGISYDNLEGILDGIPARSRVLLIDACHAGELDKESVTQPENETTKEFVGDIGFDENEPSENTSNENGIKTRNISDVKVVDRGSQNSFNLMKELFEDLRANAGTKVISAAGGVEYAQEGGEYKNGIFTHCLLTGLQDKLADLDKNGIIMLSELQNYLAVKVPELTNGEQQPTSRVENRDLDWKVW